MLKCYKYIVLHLKLWLENNVNEFILLSLTTLECVDSVAFSIMTSEKCQKNSTDFFQHC